MYRFCVIGHPIRHSWSPFIHERFGRELGVAVQYEKFCLGVETFQTDFEQLLQTYAPHGMNVTVPFKLNAFTLASDLTERARLAGAVNTLKFSSGRTEGDNTDGCGFIRDIELRSGLSLTNRSLLIMGTGGATRGLLAALRSVAGVSVTVVGRDRQKAQTLAGEFSSDAMRIAGCDYAGLGAHYDVLVNATTLSMQGKLPAVSDALYAQSLLAYDLFYGVAPTVFLTQARAAGCPAVLDGLGMLVEQAAESFYVWTGLRPQTQSVYEALRATLK